MITKTTFKDFDIGQYPSRIFLRGYPITLRENISIKSLEHGLRNNVCRYFRTLTQHKEKEHDFLFILFFYFRVDSNRNDKGNDSTNTVLETSPFFETILRILSLSYKTYTLYLFL